ncbi:MAG: hypothetical protein AAGC56_09545 [Pseudomonadota bacterium]
MIIVAPARDAAAVYADRRPAHVISITSTDEPVPHLAGLDPDAHLNLVVENDATAAVIAQAARGRAERLMAFLQHWDAQSDVLVHCNRGVSRSMGAAYVMMCHAAPDASEADLARALRSRAPHADPCPLIIDFADTMMGRDGRMVDAIDDLCPPCADCDAPPVYLPASAPAVL